MVIFGLLFWFSVLFILYVYIGYPFFLTVLAHLKRRPDTYPLFTPKVTLVIAAYNEEKAIASKLENTLALDFPKENLQILVAADGSDDRTVEIVRTFSAHGVELSYQPERRGKMAAIDSAMTLVRNEIVLFSDANNLYNKDALLELVKPFFDPNVGGVSGSKNILESRDSLSKADGMYWRYESYIKMQETRLSSCTSAPGEILAIRRSLYRSLPPWIINDDFFIALNILRQGYRLVYAPAACSFEYSSLTEEDEDIRRSRIVAGRYQAMAISAELLPWRNPLLVWQIVSHKFMRPFVPLAMISAFFLNILALIWAPLSPQNKLLELAWPYNAFFFVSQVIFYLVAWFGSNFKKSGRVAKLLYIPAFLVNSNLSALRGLLSFFTGKQTSLWQRARRRGETVD